MMAVNATTTYQPGDEVDINGTTITLCRRKGSTGVRWTWMIPAIDVTGEAYQTSPEAAIEHARKMFDDLCACGDPAAMAASTRRTCTNCYDRHAG